MRSLRRGLCVAQALLAVACGSTVGTAEGNCEGGGIAAAAEQDLNARGARQLRVERLKSSPPFSWGHIASGTISGRRVYLLDQMNKRVVLVSLDGDRTVTWGKEGRGPGEFKYPVAIGLVGNALQVYDPALARITVFPGDQGSAVETVRVPSDPQIGQVWEGAFDLSGDLFLLSYADYQGSLMKELGRRGAGEVRGRVSIKRLTPGDEDPTELASVSGPEVYVDLGRGAIRGAPFAKRPLWATDDRGGVWYGDSGSFRIEHLAAGGGAVTCSIRVHIAARKPTLTDKNRYYRALDIDDSELRPSVVESRKALPLPDSLPLLADLLVADNGNVWTARRDADEGGKRRWDIFDGGSGEPLFHLSLPTSTRLLSVSGDTALAVVVDSLGGESPALLVPLESVAPITAERDTSARQRDAHQ